MQYIVLVEEESGLLMPYGPYSSREAAVADMEQYRRTYPQDTCRVLAVSTPTTLRNLA
jgi:hypothetical protein